MVGIRLQSCKHLQTFRGFWCVLCGWTGRNARGTGKSKRNSISTTPGFYHSLNIGKCPNMFRFPFSWTSRCCCYVLLFLSCLVMLDCVKVPDLSHGKFPPGNRPAFPNRRFDRTVPGVCGFRGLEMYARFVNVSWFPFFGASFHFCGTFSAWMSNLSSLEFWLILGGF